MSWDNIVLKGSTQNLLIIIGLVLAFMHIAVHLLKLSRFTTFSCCIYNIWIHDLLSASTHRWNIVCSRDVIIVGGALWLDERRGAEALVIRRDVWRHSSYGCWGGWRVVLLCSNKSLCGWYNPCWLIGRGWSCTTSCSRRGGVYCWSKFGLIIVCLRRVVCQLIGECCVWTLREYLSRINCWDVWTIDTNSIQRTSKEINRWSSWPLRRTQRPSIRKGQLHQVRSADVVTLRDQKRTTGFYFYLPVLPIKS